MRISPHIRAARYIAFAVIAAGVNFLAQAGSLGAYPGPYSLWFSIFLGTVAGFLVKFVLDKYFIFFDRREAAAAEFAKISIYGLTAIVTTMVFWFAEFAGWTLWKTSFAKYAGGAVGLGAGYALKYFLDRRFVFKSAAP